MRYVAFDVGGKRTGVAAGSDVIGTANPVAVIETADPQMLEQRMVDAVAAHGADVLVMGLPLNMDGTEGEPARRIRVLAERLANASGKVVMLVDERLSTAAANEKLAGTGLSHGQKKARRDAIAAAGILQDYLNAHGMGSVVMGRVEPTAG